DQVDERMIDPLAKRGVRATLRSVCDRDGARTPGSPLACCGRDVHGAHRLVVDARHDDRARRAGRPPAVLEHAVRVVAAGTARPGYPWPSAPSFPSARDLVTEGRRAGRRGWRMAGRPNSEYPLCAAYRR